MMLPTCWILYFLLFLHTYGSKRPVIPTVATETCRVPAPLSLNIVPCYCDRECSVFADCCHQLDGPLSPYFSCLKLKSLPLTPVAHVTRKESVFIISRCPLGTNKELKDLCEKHLGASDGLDRKALIVGNESLFRNVYCAMCHNASYQQPTMKLECRDPIAEVSQDRVFEMTEIDNVTKRYACKISQYNIDYRKHRECHVDLKSDCGCNDNGTSIRSTIERCATQVTRYVKCKGSTTIYRNLQCALCNNPECVPGPKHIIIVTFLVYRYSILLNFKDLISRPYPENQQIEAQFENSTNMTNNRTSPVPSVSPNAFLTIINLVSCAVSVLALTILLIVYALIPSLHNFGGFLTTSLASGLLVGMMCFLVGPLVKHMSGMCRFVAVLMYFAYLSSFAWMSLFAADVLRTFTSSRRTNSPARSSSSFLKFAAGGWLLPLLVTASAVIVDARWPESNISGRFGRGQCYFNNGYALLAWFYVPVAVAVLGNVAMGIVVIVIMWRTTIDTNTIQGQRGSRKQLIVVAVKITAIFGVCWLSGLITALLQNEVTSVISSIITSLQGVFVSLSLVFSERTIREVRTRWRSTLRSSSGMTRVFALTNRVPEEN